MPPVHLMIIRKPPSPLPRLLLQIPAIPPLPDAATSGTACPALPSCHTLAQPAHSTHSTPSPSRTCSRKKWVAAQRCTAWLGHQAQRHTLVN